MLLMQVPIFHSYSVQRDHNIGHDAKTSDVRLFAGERSGGSAHTPRAAEPANAESPPTQIAAGGLLGCPVLGRMGSANLPRAISAGLQSLVPTSHHPLPLEPRRVVPSDLPTSPHRSSVHSAQ